MSWIFLGAGNMASSLVGGLLNEANNTSSIALVDPDDEACTRANRKFGVLAVTSMHKLLDDAPEGFFARAPGVVIAVKPHIVQDACKSVSELTSLNSDSGAVTRPSLAISVAAGVRTAAMEEWLPEGIAVVRCMPNTPALLGLGATAVYANSHCNQQHKSQVEQLLEATGMSLWVSDETRLDAVTALSGSGPAYFFYLIENMIESAVSLGLDRNSAQELAIETAFGAASMARERNQSALELRTNVTSKGGTTAAAIAEFDRQNLPEIVRCAMQAAHDRAVEIGNDIS
ncbi:MAG: pyrroline-5-carboxylate reductase [Granulosicoccus sp.]